MKELINPKENTYFGVSVFISVILYLLLIVSIVGLVYIILGVIMVWLLQGFMVAQIKANSVKISERQFPDVYASVKDLGNKLKLQKLPEVYVMQAGGMLNAFATRFMSRDFVLIYSDIFELAYSEGKEALDFIICHELAHIKRKHIQNRWLVLPASLIPFLGTAYSRACEYTCDNFGAAFVPQGSVNGLTLLAVGTKLYKQVNLEEIMAQSREGGFFMWLQEACATHPNLTKRITSVSENASKLRVNNL